MVLFASPGAPSGAEKQADVAQLVERNLAKVEVASSSLVVRSERVSSPSSGGLAERRGNGLQIRVHGFKSRTHLAAPPFPRAIGAAVARFLDTEEVTGSNPVSPTRQQQPLTCIGADLGAVLIPPRVGSVPDGAAHLRGAIHDHRTRQQQGSSASVHLALARFREGSSRHHLRRVGHDGTAHVSVSVNNSKRTAGVFPTSEQAMALAQQLQGEVGAARTSLAHPDPVR